MNLLPIIQDYGLWAVFIWWSWHPAARMLFKMIDRTAWKESVHNPVKMLREIPREILVYRGGGYIYITIKP